MKKTAYVTGATGCIGRNLIERLLEDGTWNIVALVRASSDIKPLLEYGIQIKEISNSAESIAAAITEDKVECMFHCAGNTSYDTTEAYKIFKDNVIFSDHLALACRDRKVERFIFVSTAATYGYDSKYVPKNLYIFSKLVAEQFIRLVIPDAIIIKPTIVIGKYDKNNYNKIFDIIKNNKIVPTFPGMANFCTTKAVTKAILNAYYDGEDAGIYYIMGENMYWFRFYRKIADQLGTKNKFVVVPKFVLHMYAMYCNLKQKLFGIKPLITSDVVSLLTSKIVFIDTSASDNIYKPERVSEGIKEYLEWANNETSNKK